MALEPNKTDDDGKPRYRRNVSEVPLDTTNEISTDANKCVAWSQSMCPSRLKTQGQLCVTIPGTLTVMII